jgi:hypothetical protein
MAVQTSETAVGNRRFFEVKSSENSSKLDPVQQTQTPVSFNQERHPHRASAISV